MELIDTHCHAHWKDFGIDTKVMLKNAKDADVTKIICIGTDYNDSQNAVEFAQLHKNVWASVGIHPHEAKKAKEGIIPIEQLIDKPKVVAIGECGLDYYYNHSPKKDQISILKKQLELAIKVDLPVIFHVRDAYSDFWPIIDEFKGLRAVFHCFSAGTNELDEIIKRDFYVGLNGIVTFSKNQVQIQAFKAVSLNKLILETDAPYLTPTPYRGKTNEPKNVAVIAEFLSNLRGENLSDLALATTANAIKLFGLEN